MIGQGWPVHWLNVGHLQHLKFFGVSQPLWKQIHTSDSRNSMWSCLLEYITSWASFIDASNKMYGSSSSQHSPSPQALPVINLQGADSRIWLLCQYDGTIMQQTLQYSFMAFPSLACLRATCICIKMCVSDSEMLKEDENAFAKAQWHLLLPHCRGWAPFSFRNDWRQPRSQSSSSFIIHRALLSVV